MKREMFNSNIKYHSAFISMNDTYKSWYWLFEKVSYRYWLLKSKHRENIVNISCWWCCKAKAGVTFLLTLCRKSYKILLLSEGCGPAQDDEYGERKNVCLPHENSWARHWALWSQQRLPSHDTKVQIDRYLIYFLKFLTSSFIAFFNEWNSLVFIGAKS